MVFIKKKIDNIEIIVIDNNSCDETNKLVKNFMIENKTGKLVAMDTEHFLTIVGIKEKIQFKNYLEWFIYLATKCAKDWFFRNKKERHLAQIIPHNQALI